VFHLNKKNTQKELKMKKLVNLVVIALFAITMRVCAQLSIYSSTPGAGWQSVTDVLDYNGNPIGDNWSNDGPEAGIMNFLNGSGAWVGYSASPVIPLNRIQYWGLDATTPDPSFGVTFGGLSLATLLAEKAGYAHQNISSYGNGSLVTLFLGSASPGATANIPAGNWYLTLTSPAGVFSSEQGSVLQNVFVARDQAYPNVLYVGFEDLSSHALGREPDFNDHILKLETQHVPEASTWAAIVMMVVGGGFVIWRRRSQ